jgi:prephenate dehydrogenase
MAGSEQLGIEGAAADLFDGAVWVLTPDAGTDADAYARLRTVLASLGAEVLALSPQQHDELVAVVSHVPHLAAASLMRVASGRAEDHRALLRLAAGGFRDMTRIAAGSPAIWPDVCLENREAILATFDGFLAALTEIRSMVAGGDREGLLRVLGEAQGARRNLPGRATQPDDLAEIRTLLQDRPGQLAEVTTLASQSGVNIFNIDIVHSSEGAEGLLVTVVDAAVAERFRTVLADRGYPSTVRYLQG